MLNRWLSRHSHLRAQFGRSSRIAYSLAGCWLLGVFTLPILAQQQFKLAEDDTWQQGETVDPTTPEGQLLEARKALAASENRRAERLASQWIERNERHAWLPQAYLIRADALLADGNEYEALFDYEYIARVFPGSDVFVTALERELDIARFYAAGNYRKLWGMRIINADSEAEELFIRVQERMPGSQLAEDAGMHLGDFYFERRKMNLAVDAYSLFIENYPRSEQLSKARRRLVYAHLASFKGPHYDAGGLNEARTRLREIQTFQPLEAEQIGAQGLITRVDESNAMKLLETAKWYLRVNDPIAAEFTIRRLVKKYERSVATADALRLIPEILPQLPKRVLEQAPDYAALRAAILGVQESEPPTEANSAATKEPSP